MGWRTVRPSEVDRAARVRGVTARRLEPGLSCRSRSRDVTKVETAHLRHPLARGAGRRARRVPPSVLRACAHRSCALPQASYRQLSMPRFIHSICCPTKPRALLSEVVVECDAAPKAHLAPVRPESGGDRVKSDAAPSLAAQILGQAQETTPMPNPDLERYTPCRRASGRRFGPAMSACCAPRGLACVAHCAGLQPRHSGPYSSLIKPICWPASL
eukprot:2630584-Prymnesium_polylepis.1